MTDKANNSPAASTEANQPRTEVYATPHDVPGEFDASTPFWLPTWQESTKLLGWRWAIVAVLAGASGVLVWLFMHDWRFIVGFSGVIIKLGPLVIAGGLSLWAYLRKSATRFRTDPFCVHCGYSLAGHNDGDICPECGRRSSFAVCREYKRDPHWFIQRYRNRGKPPPAGVALVAGPNRRKATDGTE